MAAATSSCTLDTVSEQNPGSVISFRTIPDSYTRALEVEQSNLPSMFVYAYEDGALRYGDIYRWQSGNQFDSDHPHYWPADESKQMTFLAYNYEENIIKGTTNKVLDEYSPKFSMDDPAAAKITVTIPSDGRKQKDLAIARKAATSADGVPQLVFKHAFARISVEARNSNPNMKVEVAGVRISNLWREGTLTFPTTDTDAATDLAGITLWGNGTKHTHKYNREVMLKKAEEITTATDGDELTDAYANIMPEENGERHSFMLLPQDISPRNGTAYICVLCRIYQAKVPKPAGDSDWRQLYPLTEGKYAFTRVAIPPDTWEPGKHYTYKLDFFSASGGSAGQVPDPPKDIDTGLTDDPGIEQNPGTAGDPVVGGPIKISLTMDTWDETNSTNNIDL